MKRSKIKKFNELSDDLKNDIFEIESEIKGGDKFEIESIIDIFLEPPTEEKISESGMIAFNADLTNKEVKRGDVVYITAMIKKPGSSYTSPASQAILKMRIIDIYHGLSYLNKFIG